MTAKMSAVLDRLTTAGWIDQSYLNDQSLKIHWTEQGLARAIRFREEAEALGLLDFDPDALACLSYLLKNTLPPTEKNERNVSLPEKFSRQNRRDE